MDLELYFKYALPFQQFLRNNEFVLYAYTLLNKYKNLNTAGSKYNNITKAPLTQLPCNIMTDRK